MKHALTLIAACCVLCAQNKPDSDDPGAILRRAAQDMHAAEAPKPASVEKDTKSVTKIPPVNVRDELICLVHALKKQAEKVISTPIHMGSDGMRAQLSAKYDSDLKAKSEAQRLLLQALVELAKEAEKKEPTKVYHSSNPFSTGMSR